MEFLPQVLAQIPTLASSLGISFGESSLRTLFILAGVFLLLVLLGLTRKHLLGYSFKGGYAGFGLGVIFTLVIEILLLLGGRTLLTESLGWKDAPPALTETFDRGKEEVAKDLGVEKASDLEIGFSTASDSASSQRENFDNAESFLSSYQKLTPLEAGKVKSRVCAP